MTKKTNGIPTDSDQVIHIPKAESLAGVKIGFFTSVVGMGGSEVLIADAMEAAFQAGAEVICWSDRKAAIRKITEEREGKLEVTHLDWPMETEHPTSAARIESAGKSHLPSLLWRKAVPMPLKRWYGFKRMSQKFALELLHVAPNLLFVSVNGSEAVSLAGPVCGVKVMNCYHLSLTTPPGGFFARWEDWRARHATMNAGQWTIHTSKAVREQWCRACKYPLSQTRLIYNGVDSVEAASRSSTRSAIGLTNEDFVFCVPARLDPIKGHAYLIDALRTVRDRIVPVRVLFCGDGPIRAELEQASKEAGLGDTIRFMGWRSDLNAILHASDCTVLPSIASENLSVAVLESLMAGVPAIVTSVGGMAEAILHEATGLVVPPADPVSLGIALVKLKESPELTRSFGQRAKEDAQHRFTRKRMKEDYVRVFSEAITSPMVASKTRIEHKKSFYKRIKSPSWMNKPLRSFLFDVFKKATASDNGRAIVVSTLNGLLNPHTEVLESLNCQPEPSYLELGRFRGRIQTALRPDIIIITARFRTGSTLLWNLFRNTDGMTAYFEPLNPVRWFDPKVSIGRDVDPSHRGIKEYCSEYEGLFELDNYFQDRWHTRNYLMGPDFWDPELKRYIEILIERAKGRPVLQFNRIDFRLPWVRKNFPNARVIHLVRHPRDQWCSSLVDNKVNANIGFGVKRDCTFEEFRNIDYHDLMVWARDLRHHFPFLDEQRLKHPYQMFYFIWKLSYLFGKKYSHYTLQYESLLENPETQVRQLMIAACVNEFDANKLQSLLVKNASGRWKKYADHNWFLNHEEYCENILADFLGKK